MLSTTGLLDYLAELIWCFSCIDTEQLSSKPLMIAHCVGALKICHSLSTNLIDSDKIFDGPVLGAVKSFLLTSCSVLLVGLKEDADYIERSNARFCLFTPDEEIFIDSGTPRGDSEGFGKFAKYPSSSADRTSRRSGIESQIAEHESAPYDLKRPSQQLSDFPSVAFESESGLISPFCADPTTQGDQIQALIAQVTFEKTFSGDKEDESPNESTSGAFDAQSSTQGAKVFVA